MNGYELSHSFFEWSFENPEKVSPNHAAIYFFAIEHCNRLGWKDKFGFPTQMTMDAIGIKKHHTYIRYFNDLVEWGFFKLIQKSSNQYSANIISLKSAMPKKGKALGKATVKHGAKQPAEQTDSMGQSIGCIDKPLTTEPLNLEPSNETPPADSPKVFKRPSVSDLFEHLRDEKKITAFDANKFANEFFNHYESNGWKVGKNPMKNWKAALTNWISRSKEFKNNNNAHIGNNKSTGTSKIGTDFSGAL